MNYHLLYDEARLRREAVAVKVLQELVSRYPVPFNDAAIESIVSQAFKIGVEFARQSRELSEPQESK